MHRGYIKIWRKSVDNGWLHNHLLWTFWCWCLMKATHKEIDVMVGYQKVHLEPGQLVFGRNNAAHELRASPQNIRTCINALVKLENLTIKSTNKFSIITILNWDTYQDDQPITNQQLNKPLTSNQPATNHKQTHISTINTKRIKDTTLPSWLPADKWQSLKEYRKAIRKPFTANAENLAIKKLEQFMGEGHDPADVIDNIILSGWTGIYAPKEKSKLNSDQPHYKELKAPADGTY